MTHITTKCPNCGFKIRNNERNVPHVQLGSPIVQCPSCYWFTFDGIATEYEFMTDDERERFPTKAAVKSLLGLIIESIMGIAFLICCIIFNSNGYGMIGVAFGAASVFMTPLIVHAIKKRKTVNTKQEMYASLQRTANKQYVQFLTDRYSARGANRQYVPYLNRESYIRKYKGFEKQASYIEEMETFHQFMALISKNPPQKTPSTEDL